MLIEQPDINPEKKLTFLKFEVLQLMTSEFVSKPSKVQYLAYQLNNSLLEIENKIRNSN